MLCHSHKQEESADCWVIPYPEGILDEASRDGLPLTPCVLVFNNDWSEVFPLPRITLFKDKVELRFQEERTGIAVLNW